MGKKESTILVSTCRILESTKAPGRRALGPSAGCGRAGRWRNLEVPRTPRGGGRPAGSGSPSLPMSALQNACCGCTGEQLQASARGATSPAAGGRTRAAGCGPRRRAEGRGRGLRAGRRRLGSGRSSRRPGPRWSGRHSAGALSSPALTRRTNFLGSRLRGAAKGARGAADGAEARAGWGAASPARHGPGQVLHCLLWLCALRVRAGLLCASRRFGSAPGGQCRLRELSAASLPAPPPPGPPPSPAFVVPSLAARAPAAHLASHRSEPHPPQPPRSPEVGGGGHCRQTAPSGP